MDWKAFSKSQKIYYAQRSYNAAKYKTIQEAATNLRISKSTIYRWAKKSNKFTPRRKPKRRIRRRPIKFKEKLYKEISYVYDLVIINPRNEVAQTHANRCGIMSITPGDTERAINRKFNFYKIRIERHLYRQLKQKRERGFKSISSRNTLKKGKWGKLKSPFKVEYHIKVIRANKYSEY